MRFRTRRHNRNAYYLKYVCDESIGKNDSYVDFRTSEFIVHPNVIENCGFWVHEFSEIALIQLLNSTWLRKPWMRTLKFDGFRATTIAHLITPFGMKNNRNLFPQQSKNDPEW